MESEFLDDDLFLLDLEISNKQELFELVAKHAKKLNLIEDEEGLIQDLFEKEKYTATYLGNECSIPHVRSSKINKNTILFFRLSNGIEWSDKDTAKYIFVILAKKEDRNLHIDQLKSVSKKILDKKKFEIFKNSQDKKEILSILKS
ncbi:PTS sugar transporter subunit IIA [Oceanivirga salmonicida]|uniref:PTS sugar transporter subunit IIA n=1 Tax=Oceanivirga salmonicida TaxID=1769291 RepID=UPI00082F0ED5|nr:PTS sugar transporter subunit IIA [Oceanivirga salmonicida]